MLGWEGTAERALEDVGILQGRIEMAVYHKPTSMDRSGSNELTQERSVPKELASSRGRKVLEVGDDGSGRCGICSGHVAIRGVLDCCSHEYCFDCIENWSSVSNMCPLCKLQFRFISVENVHCQENDKLEDYCSFPSKQERDDESWGYEDPLSLSFPSFFIDEDAVACLEGNRCLVRAGIPLQDEDAADTSVACDSCDRWYHAGCVGFDPSISWGSWLCPRCSENAADLRAPPAASLPSILPLTTVVSSFTSGQVPVAELAFSAPVFTGSDPTVSVSVVDEGESALVISSVAVESTNILPPKLEIHQARTDTDPRGQASVIVKTEEVTYTPLDDKVANVQVPGSSAFEKVDIVMQKAVDSSSVPFVLNLSEPGTTNPTRDLVDRRLKETTGSSIEPITSVKTEQCDLPVVALQGLQLSQRKELEADQVIPDIAESADLPASYFDNVEFEEQPRKEKRKQITRQDRDFVRAEDLPEPPRKVARSASKKKDIVQESPCGLPLEKSTVHSAMDSKASVTKVTSLAAKNKIDHKIPYTENVSLEDLVHLVRDKHAIASGIIKEEPGGIESNSAGGVRTRMVMRRDSDGRAAQIVEDIRQQMRAASGYGAADDHGKVAVSDDRFFSAFKAAMVRNNEQAQGSKSKSLKRRRNSWLERMLDKAPRGKAGGVRESLTKKLYAGGVARKTWDRDWDVSFWKEQSARIKKAKQEASDVVEGRAGMRGGEISKGTITVKEEMILERLKNVNNEGDSILSRLYVADTSLFPRDNDIKPLVNLLADVKEEGKPKCSGGEKATSVPKNSMKAPKCSSQKATETKITLLSGGGGASNKGASIPLVQDLKVPSRDTSENTSKVKMKGSGMPGTLKHVESPVKPPRASDSDGKKDKRQWALELLARKSGDATASSSAKSHGGTRNEFLLSQVPEDLRPTLPPDRRSRVPTAVRQGQLNRILEHYLRKAKLASLQGGYKLKSLIASAVAKELEIYEQSNTKGVYVNLCVRALAQQDEVRLQVTVPKPKSEPAQSDGAGAVNEALLATGLISDSPPGSPLEQQNATTPSRDVLNDQALENSPIRDQAALSGVFVGSKDATLLVHSQVENAGNVLNVSKPVSDVHEELDLDLGEVKTCDGDHGKTLCANISPVHPVSPKNKMKAVLISGSDTNFRDVIDNERLSEEPSSGREIDMGVEAGKADSKGSSTAAYPQSRSFINDQSTSSQEVKHVDMHVSSTTKFTDGLKTEATIALSKVGEECSVVPGEGRACVKYPKDAGKVGGVPIRSGVEPEGDDWMKTGKFPDLDSRIDKMRKDVLKMNSTFLSQFDEEHVFGGSLHNLTSTDEVWPEGGNAGAVASTLKVGAGDACISNRKHNGSNHGGKEAEASISVQKQVEAYVKEHLKPLYKSGVIKSDQFRFAVSKTASKVMLHHGDATSAEFLIVEGSKVKKLADQYLQSYVQKK